VWGELVSCKQPNLWDTYMHMYVGHTHMLVIFLFGACVWKSSYHCSAQSRTTCFMYVPTYLPTLPNFPGDFLFISAVINSTGTLSLNQHSCSAVGVHFSSTPQVGWPAVTFPSVIPFSLWSFCISYLFMCWLTWECLFVCVCALLFLAAWMYVCMYVSLSKTHPGIYIHCHC
jgi:hypothetical protein